MLPTAAVGAAYTWSAVRMTAKTPKVSPASTMMTTHTIVCHRRYTLFFSIVTVLSFVRCFCADNGVFAVVTLSGRNRKDDPPPSSLVNCPKASSSSLPAHAAGIRSDGTIPAVLFSGKMPPHGQRQSLSYDFFNTLYLMYSRVFSSPLSRSIFSRKDNSRSVSG